MTPEVAIDQFIVMMQSNDSEKLGFELGSSGCKVPMMLLSNTSESCHHVLPGHGSSSSADALDQEGDHRAAIYDDDDGVDIISNIGVDVDTKFKLHRCSGHQDRTPGSNLEPVKAQLGQHGRDHRVRVRASARSQLGMAKVAT